MPPRDHLPNLRAFASVRRVLILAWGGLLLVHGACATEAGRTISPAIDPAFNTGLASLRKAARLIEPSNALGTQWQPNLQLLVGVKAVEGSKSTVRFVELTTLRPPATNAAGQPWTPPLRTNDWSWRGTNRAPAAHQHAEFVSALYPVRARVFDGSGQMLKEGRTTLPWGLVTNGLVDMCRISLSLAKDAERKTVEPPGVESRKEALTARLAQNDDLMRSVGGGFLWLITMFGQFQTVPAVEDVWAKAQCACRFPGFWTVTKSVFGGNIAISLEPRLEEISVVESESSDAAARCYRFPLEVTCEKRKLTRAEMIVGSARGAEMLLAGIKSIRAVHPTKPNHEFMAQVLAAGMVRDGEEAADGNRRALERREGKSF